MSSKVHFCVQNQVKCQYFQYNFFFFPRHMGFAHKEKNACCHMI